MEWPILGQTLPHVDVHKVWEFKLAPFAWERCLWWELVVQSSSTMQGKYINPNIGKKNQYSPTAAVVTSFINITSVWEIPALHSNGKSIEPCNVCLLSFSVVTSVCFLFLFRSFGSSGPFSFSSWTFTMLGNSLPWKLFHLFLCKRRFTWSFLYVVV